MVSKVKFPILIFLFIFICTGILSFSQKSNLARDFDLKRTKAEKLLGEFRILPELTRPRTEDSDLAGLAQDPNVEYMGSALWSGIIDVQVVENYAYCVFRNGLVILDISDLTSPFLISRLYLHGEGESICVEGDYAYVADGNGGLRIANVSNPVNPTLAGSYDTPGYAWDVYIESNLAYVADHLSGLHIINVANPANPIWVGSYDTPDQAVGVFVSGVYAFVADVNSGLQIIDISYPATPSLVGSIDSMGFPVDVYVSGNYAYAAIISGPGLQIIDISDPSSPALVALYETPSDAWRVYVSEDYAYVADICSGLQIVDVSNPVSPAFAGSYYTPGGAMGVSILGSYAFVAAWTSLQVLDISNPTDPGLAGSCNTPGHAYDVYVSGNYAYVADRDSGLQVVDVSDPANPVLTGSCDTPGSAYGVYVSGNYAYVADMDSGLQIVDILDPANPDLVGSCNSIGYARDVHVSGDCAFVAAQHTGLRIIDVSNPGNPISVGSFSAPGFYAQGVYISSNYAYVAGGGGGLHIIDVSNPSNPTLTGSHDTPDYARDVCVSGNYAYVADEDSGLQIIDVSDPGSPFLAASYIDPHYGYGMQARGIAVVDDYAYVAYEEGGLEVIDVSDPEDPSFTGSCNPSGRVYDVYVAGDYAFVVDGDDLLLIDVSNPSDPASQGSYDTSVDVIDVTVWNNYAFVANGDDGLRVIDVFDPANPALTGSHDTPGSAKGVYVLGDYAYVADDQSGVQIIDVSYPASPALTGSYDTPGNAYDVFVSGNYAYMADRGGGLQIIDVSNPSNPTFEGSYDTPGNAYGVYVSGDYAYVADYDEGLQVIDVSNPASPTFTGSYYWPGSRSYGVHVSGNYAYVAEKVCLRIIDVSDPANPTFVNAFAISGYHPNAVYISGNYAYVAAGTGGLQIIDVSDPENPVLAAWYDTPGSADGVDVVGNHVFLADRSSIMILRSLFVGVITGTVQDWRNGQAIEGALVQALEQDITHGEGVTDEEGVYSISVPAGSYDVEASKDGYTVASWKGVDVSSSAPAEVNFSISPGIVLFSDDFSGELNWEQIPTGNPGACNWFVLDQEMVGHTVSTGEEAFCMVTAGDANWAKYTYEANLHGVEGVHKVLQFRVQDGFNHYYVSLRGQPGQEELWLCKIVDGNNVHTEKVSFLNYNGAWYNIKVKCLGNQFRVYVNDEFVLSYMDSENTYPRGKIGLGVWTRDATVNLVKFDNIAVYDGRFCPYKHGWRFTNKWGNMWPYSHGFNCWGEDVIWCGDRFQCEDVFPSWDLFVEAFNVGPDNRESALEFWNAKKECWGGSCFGFATSSLLYFNVHLCLPDDFPGNSTLYDVPLNDESRRLVNMYQLYWWGKEHETYRNANSDKTPRETLEELQQMLITEDNSNKVLYLGDQDGTGAHAVVACRIVQDQVNPDVYHIYVYDSNHLPEYQVIDIDVSTPEGSWYYNREPDWGGDGYLILMDPIDTYVEHPTLPTGSSWKSDYGGGTRDLQDYIEVYCPSSNDALISNSYGESIGYFNSDSIVIDSMMDASPIIPITGTEHPPVGYFLPKGIYTAQITNSVDTTFFLSVFSDSSVFSYRRKDFGTSQTDKLKYFDNGMRFQVRTNDPEPKNTNLKCIGVQPDQEIVCHIQNLVLSQDDSVELGIIDQNQFKLTNTGGSKNYNLTLKLASADLNPIFEHDSISMSEFSSHQIAPNWEELDTMAVPILIDNDLDGIFDDTIFIENQYVHRGDCNGDGVIDIGDVVCLINYLYKSGPAPDPLPAGDCNCDGIVDLGDVVYLINYLYRGGPPPCR